MLDLANTTGGCAVGLKVQPNAKRPGLVGIHGSRLKVALAAPAVDGKANKALIEFLAGFASVPRSAVEIVRGETSRDKTVRIAGRTCEEFTALLRQAGIELEEQSPS